jgi:hypothetical protein
MDDADAHQTAQVSQGIKWVGIAADERKPLEKLGAYCKDHADAQDGLPRCPSFSSGEPERPKSREQEEVSDLVLQCHAMASGFMLRRFHMLHGV